LNRSSQRFTDKDRKLVVEKLEKIQNCSLKAIPPSRKLFKDSNGITYLIFGGSEDWHGITASTSHQLQELKTEGVFVVAKKYHTKIEIYTGHLLSFVKIISKLVVTKQGGWQFHTVLTGDGIYLEEAPDFFCNKWTEIEFEEHRRNLSKLQEIGRIINIEIEDELPLTHSDLQAKLVLIGSYLDYRTYVPANDAGKETIFGILGDLCSDRKIPDGAIPALSVETVKFIDVIWFDDEGYPTHAFEVEHTTDITKGLLRLFQVHKLKIKMFIISKDENKNRFQREVAKSPFSKIRQEFIFKNYDELDEFFQSVKRFAKAQENFLIK
jgi:hypothetical protein